MMNTRVQQLKERECCFHTPLKEKTTVLVIGSGIGSLSAASLLSKWGFDTLVAEQGEHLGGFFGYFTEDEYIFDTAISYVLSCDPDGAAYQLLKDMGLLEKISFKRLERLDHFVFPDNETLTMPEGFEEFREVLKERFPAESSNIDRFFAWLKEYDDGARKANQKSFSFPKLIIQNFLKDYRPFLDSYFSDPLLKNILSIRIQADPSSLMIMAGFLNECLLRGMYYIEGGSFQLPLILGEAIIDNGGQVTLGKKVDKIIYLPREDKEYPYQVKFASGETVKTKFIVNGIAPAALIDMIDLENGSELSNSVDKLKKNIQNRVIGHSSFNIYLAVKDLDLSALNAGRHYILPDNLAQQNTFEYYTRIEGGELLKDAILKVHIPSFYDNSLAPDGESIIRIETDICNDAFLSYRDNYLAGCPSAAYQEFEESICSAFLKRVEERLIPGLQDKIVYRRVISPLGFEKMTLNFKGSGTGWAHTVSNYFRHPFSTKLPIPNMYVVGQWGELGSGLRQLVLSGRRAAEQISQQK